MAVGILVFGKEFGEFFENKMLLIVGMISYEIYLAHAFTLQIINDKAIDLLEFVFVTGLCAVALFCGINKMKQIIM